MLCFQKVRRKASISSEGERDTLFLLINLPQAWCPILCFSNLIIFRLRHHD
uniref:Uncharacterized protein n=1 Tax=Anguilla anguilla TaxID=7936 RepID=A0A0E9SX02_ANGAN